MAQSPRQIRPLVAVLDAADGNEVGTTIQIKDFRHLILQFGTDNSADMTVQFQGSSSVDAPTFSSAQSLTNHWDYLAVYDLEDSSLIEGDTGISLTGTDDFRNLMVNVDGMSWFNAEVSSRVAGDATVKLIGFTA